MLYNATNIRNIIDKKKTLEGLLSKKSPKQTVKLPGSVLLGTSKTVVKGHGSSKAVAVEKCIEQAYKMEKSQLSSQIETEIQKYEHYTD